MQDAGLFTVPASAGFDPVKPWRLEILVNGEATTPVTVAFGLDYTVPDLQALTSLDDTPAERRGHSPSCRNCRSSAVAKRIGGVGAAAGLADRRLERCRGAGLGRRMA